MNAKLHWHFISVWSYNEYLSRNRHTTKQNLDIRSGKYRISQGIHIIADCIMTLAVCEEKSSSDTANAELAFCIIH